MTRFVITGATGTIGSALSAALIARGDSVVALTRSVEHARGHLPPRVELASWPAPTQAPPPASALAGADVVVNLIGESISQRWTAAAKQRIRDSRIRGTELLLAALSELAAGQRPTVLISQSATGYYGDRGDQTLPEEAAPGSGFLADVVRDWERAALAAAPQCRVVCTRTGVVLSSSGGALARMLPFFRLCVGGPIGSGKQYLPWIHLDDVVDGLLFCAESAALAGPVNLTAPSPVTSAEFALALGEALHRPAVLPTPALALKALYGEMSEIVLTGQRAVPRHLQQHGFQYRFPQVGPALVDVLR